MFFDEFLKLQKELDNIFGRELYPHPTFGKGTYPAINIFEKDETLTLVAEIPGMNKEEIEIKLEGDVIGISGERKNLHSESARYHRRERDFGRFQRQMKLPYRVNAEKAKAKMENGVLTLTLPKEESEKARLISIN